MDILRFNTDILLKLFLSDNPGGVILPGVVGAGKTSMIAQLCALLAKNGYEIATYDGDDSLFRTQIRATSRYILDDIQSRGMQRPFVYVDEVQKEPQIFDAIKMAFDKAKASFIVSGSNPALLRTSANDRLQRRAVMIPQLPLSMAEIALHQGLISKKQDLEEMTRLLTSPKNISSVTLTSCRLPDAMGALVNRYLVVGGLPQAWLAKSDVESFRAVKLIAERGISETYQTTIAADDEIRRFLADRNAQEFAYKGIQQTLRSSKRAVVDRVIDHLLNHGYLFKRTPYLGQYSLTHSTYFANYSWVDPGIVSYYSTAKPSPQELGFRLESYVYTRLFDRLAHVPFKSSIYYFKPFKIKPSNDALSFGSGEIDFIIQIGREVIPIEVKATARIRDVDTSLMEEFISEHRAHYGIVLYGGSTYVDSDRKIIFYPYWLI